jgi:hypothetical protein
MAACLLLVDKCMRATVWAVVVVSLMHVCFPRLTHRLPLAWLCALRDGACDEHDPLTNSRPLRMITKQKHTYTETATQVWLRQPLYADALPGC